MDCPCHFRWIKARPNLLSRSHKQSFSALLCLSNAQTDHGSPDLVANPRITCGLPRTLVIESDSFGPSRSLDPKYLPWDSLSISRKKLHKHTSPALRCANYRPAKEAGRPSFEISRIGQDKNMRKHALPPLNLVALVSAAAFLLFPVPGLAQQPLQVLHNHVRPVVSSGQAVPVGLLPPTQRLNLA